MVKKSLLEELRSLTSNYKPIEEKDEQDEIDLKDVSMKDAIDDEDKYLEDDEDSYEKQELEDDEENDHEDSDEDGEDLDGDGETDDIHALFKLKDAFDSSDDGMKHALVMFTRVILDSQADMETLQKFVDETDLEDPDEDEDEDEDSDLEDMEEYSDEDEDEDSDLEDMEEYSDEDEDEDEYKKESVDDDDFEEFKGNLHESLDDLESDRDTYFTNESIIADDYDMMDMLD